MRLSFRSVIVALFAGSLLAPTAMAQDDDYDDLDNSGGSARKERQSRSEQLGAMEVREISRGFYAKTNIGGWLYFGKFRSPYVKPGTSVALAVGQDFVNQERQSMAWEIAFFQGIHNGMHYELQSQDPGAPGIQGDLRTYSLVGTIEWATYPSRRLGLGVRGGGGVMLSPLLIEDTAWAGEVQPRLPQYQGYHESPHPMVVGGPTLEYYTKMSHFSVGIDVDATYAIGFDFGLSATGNLKYTF